VRNKAYIPYLDIIKFILANLVVCIHFVIPGCLGDAIDCLARVAVPFFFIISGYYSYNSESVVLWRRFRRTNFILLGSSILYCIWGVWKTVGLSGLGISSFIHDKINCATAIDFLFFSVNPFSNHLWFLHALAVSYLFLILVLFAIRKEKARCMVLVSLLVILLCAHIVLGTIIPALSIEPIPKQYYRNAWLFGIPVFLIGYSIHIWKARRALAKKPNRLIQFIIVITGLALGLFQWFGIGHAEMPAGILLATVFIFLFALEQSTKTTDSKSYDKLVKISKILGASSVWIYMIHKLVGEVIEAYVPYSDFCKLVYDGALFTITVMIISTAISLIIALGVGFVKKKVLEHT